MSSKKMVAGDLFPVIELPSVTDEQIVLGVPQNGADWKLVVVYRGVHCPMCTHYLHKIEEAKADFAELGIDIVATSGDSKEQVLAHMQKLNVSFPITYGLTIEQMKVLGLYISHPRSAQETDHSFAEPGLFIINDKGQVQVVDISNGPFARPEIEVLLNGLSFIRNPDNNYPIRGTYAYE